MIDETFPRYLGYFEALLVDNGGTGFFVGDSRRLKDAHGKRMAVAATEPSVEYLYHHCKRIYKSKTRLVCHMIPVSLADSMIYDALDTVLGVFPEAVDAFLCLQKLRRNVEALPALKEYLNCH